MKFFNDIKSVGDILDKIKEYQNYILLSIGLTITLVGGTYGYLYLKQSREEKAYRVLVLALEYFDAPIIKEGQKKDEDLNLLGKKDFKNKDEKWQKVESVFNKSYKDHSSSGIAPIFLAYQAEALIKLKKLKEAIEVLRKAINQMVNEKVKNYFEVKLALMLIDTKSDLMLEQGVSLLKILALKEDNISHDVVLYNLGEYYWYKKEFGEARNYWNQFLLKYGKADKYISPFIANVKDKLKLIDSDAE